MKEKIKNFFKLDKPISIVQIFLTVLFVVCLVVSNIISGRVFNFFGQSMTSAVIIFPITYILSDLFSEVYGYKYSRLTCYLAFTLNLFVVGILALSTTLPLMYGGVDISKELLGTTFACTLASFIAFVIGDFVNDKIFAKMKQKHQGLTNHKGFTFRAILSSFAGELVDSCIYLPLAFLVFNPIMSVTEVLIMIGIQVGLKTAYEALILPLTTFLTKKVANYEYNLNYKDKQNHQININEWLYVREANIEDKVKEDNEK